MKTIFLAWAKTARRSATLAEFFKAKLIILPMARKKLFLRLWKYLFLAIKTIFILSQEKPKLIFVQCPPIQILVPVYFYTKLYKGKFVIDAHSGAFIGQGLHFPIYLRWLKFFAQRALVTIIPNEGITKYLVNWRIPYFVLEDGIPKHLPIITTAHGEPPIVRNSVVVICGFGADEPIREIIEATKLLPKVQFYVTGDKGNQWQRFCPQNLRFTGFLPEKDYINLINQVDLVVVLTTRPDTILCGAYEGLSLEKPLVLSNSLILHRYFSKGVIWVENTKSAIAQGVREAYSQLAQLKNEILELKKQKVRDWLTEAEKLKKIIKTE